MRIDRLDLTAFGPFSGVSLDLRGGSEGLHIVYGPNEAGKSSALRAIRQFFCSIPHQSPDDFLHDYKKMAIGALLRGGDGTALSLVRRKGQKNTLLNPDGTPADDGDARLARLLGGVTPEDFARRFVIDHAELVAGGKDVIAGKGDLGRALFAAGGGGLAQVGSVQKELEGIAEALFLPRGSKPSINADLARLVDLQKQLKLATLPSSEWVAQDEALRAAEAREAAIAVRRLEVDRERHRLRRLAEAVAPAARRREVLAELASLADVPRLSSDFMFRYSSAQSVIPATERAEAEALQRVAELTDRLESLDVPGPLLDQAEAIEGLHTRLGGLIQAMSERRNREAELARLETEARAALRDLGRDPESLDLEAADDSSLASLRLTAAGRAGLLELLDLRTERLRARDEARQQVEAAIARRAAVAAKLAAQGPERDSSPLRKALKQAQKLGDLESELLRSRESLTRDQARAAAALAALGRWSGPLAAVESLPVPAAETVDAFQLELDALDREAAALDREATDLDRGTRDADARLEQLRLQGEVPTEDALAIARRHRDDTWQALADGRTWEESLAATFEVALRQADELADRLRREADRVAELARLTAERARLRAGRADCGERLTRLAQRRGDARARWSALWSTTGLAEPGTPVEMRAWLRRQAEVADLARGVREQQAQVAMREAEICTHRRNLIAALTALDISSGDNDSLSDLIEQAADAIDQMKSQMTERKRYRQEVESLDADRPALDAADAAASDAWQRWEAVWVEAVRPLGLSAAAPPSAAHAVIARSAELFDRLDRARTFRQEIAATAREAERFAADVRGLALRVAPDLAPLNSHGAATLANGPAAPFDAGAVAAELSERLKRGRAARQEYEHLTRARAEKEQAAQAAREALAQHREMLTSLLREARCDAVAELPGIAQRDACRRELEAERDRIDIELRKHAAGTSLDAFVAEVEHADPDELGPRIARFEETIAALEEERQQINQQIGASRAELDRMKGGTTAAELKQQEEDLRAKVRDDVEQFARLRLAAAVLRTGMERYRKKAQDPVLARAGATFARITLGSFADLRVDYNEGDEPVLVGLRPDGEAVGVAGMSLGTADQLYLALRLATLDAALDRHEPLPLIVDDVLIQFDDARAVATLEALATFSRRAQVLLFTHHEHLVRLAENRLGSDVVLTHHLAGRSGKPA